MFCCKISIFSVPLILALVSIVTPAQWWVLCIGYWDSVVNITTHHPITLSATEPKVKQPTMVRQVTSGIWDTVDSVLASG